MRPAKKNEIGYLDHGMICCGRLVPFTAARSSGIVFAVWECPNCGETAYYYMGEPNAEKAKIVPRGGG